MAGDRWTWSNHGSSLPRRHLFRFRQAAQSQHAPHTKDRSDGEDGEHPTPIEPGLQGGYQANRHHGEQEAETRLQGKCGADVARVREFTDRGAELRAVGDNGHSPENTNRGEYSRTVKEEAGRECATS